MKEIQTQQTHHPQPHDRRWLNIVTLCLLLALSACIVTVAASWTQITGSAAGPSIDPTHWATITLTYVTGSPAPLPTGTWVVDLPRTPTPTGTPGELILPPVPSATPIPQLTIVVTGAVPITPPGLMPTPAPWCGTPPEWVHRWLCRDGKLIPITNTYLPMVRSGR